MRLNSTALHITDDKGQLQKVLVRILPSVYPSLVNSLPESKSQSQASLYGATKERYSCKCWHSQLPSTKKQFTVEKGGRYLTRMYVSLSKLSKTC